MWSRSLGDQELEVLGYVSRHAPISVGEVAEHFASTRGLARTTLATVLERLRAKGYLTRARADGPYRYSPSLPRKELLRGLVRDFAARVLGGSPQPLMQYLLEEADLTDEEVTRLQDLVRELEQKRKDGAP